MTIIKPFRSYLLLLVLLLSSVIGFSQTVYKTPSGKRYHLASCRMVENVSTKISIAEAQQLGLTPCLICKPAGGSSAQTSKPVQGTNNTTQCRGQTKAGNRCRHMTSIGNGYCYQHQPG